MSSDSLSSPVINSSLTALGTPKFSATPVPKVLPKGKNQRGVNWSDDDSLLLVQAVAHAQDNPIGLRLLQLF